MNYIISQLGLVGSQSGKPQARPSQPLLSILPDKKG